MSNQQTAISPRQQRALRAYLLKTTLPLKSGGGLVFPGGLLGGGHRLDEKQFDQYRATLKSTFVDDQGRRRTRRAVWGGILFGIALGAVIVTGTFVLTDPEKTTALATFLMDHSGLSLTVFSGAIAAILALLFYAVLRRVRRFREDFPDAIRLPQRAYFRQRMLGQVVAGGYSPRVFLAFAIGSAVLGFAFLVLAMIASQLVSFHTAGQMAPWQVLIALAYLFLAAAFGAPYWAYRSFRRQHGRAPTADDLEVM